MVNVKGLGGERCLKRRGVCAEAKLCATCNMHTAGMAIAEDNNVAVPMMVVGVD